MCVCQKIKSLIQNERDRDRETQLSRSRVSKYVLCNTLKIPQTCTPKANLEVQQARVLHEHISHRALFCVMHNILSAIIHLTSAYMTDCAIKELTQTTAL